MQQQHETDEEANTGCRGKQNSPINGGEDSAFLPGCIVQDTSNRKFASPHGVVPDDGQVDSPKNRHDVAA